MSKSILLQYTYLEQFSDINYNSDQINIFNNFDDESSLNKQVENLIYKIMINEGAYVCRAELINKIQRIILRNHYDLYTCLINGVEKALEHIFDNISNQFNNPDFVKYFLDKYTEYINNTKILQINLVLFNDLLKKNEKNMIYVLSSCMFYKQFICYCKNDIYLTESLLLNINKNIPQLLELIKMDNIHEYNTKSYGIYTSSFYERLKTYINSSCSNEFILFVINIIDCVVTKLNNKDKLDNPHDVIKSIVRYIKLSIKYGDGNMFMIKYYDFLQNRLLNGLNPDIELSLISAFNFKDECELYCKMMYCCEDINFSKYINNIIHNDYNKKHIILASDKYKNIHTFDKNICTYVVKNPYSWNKIISDTDCNNIQLNPNIEIYIDLLKKLLFSENSSFNNDFKHRAIHPNLETSTGVLKLQIQDKIYHIKANMMQITALQEIYNNAISAKDLALKLNLKLGKLFSTILTSLIQSKLVIKRSIKINDVNMKFIFNHKWENENNNFDLSELYYKSKIDIESKAVSKEIPESIKYKILIYISMSKKIGSNIVLDDVIKYLSNTHNINIPRSIIYTALTQLEEEHVLESHLDKNVWTHCTVDNEIESVTSILSYDSGPEQDIVHDNEKEDIVHDNEKEDIVHDNEKEDIVHDNEKEDIVHDNEKEDIVHDNEKEDIVHNNEKEDIVHDNEYIQCDNEEKYAIDALNNSSPANIIGDEDSDEDYDVELSMNIRKKICLFLRNSKPITISNLIIKNQLTTLKKNAIKNYLDGLVENNILIESNGLYIYNHDINSEDEKTNDETTDDETTDDEKTNDETTDDETTDDEK
jgi:hypothetical protein